MSTFVPPKSVSIAEYRAMTGVKPLKASKYRNKITAVDGIKFHSKAEAQRYVDLKREMATGGVLYFFRQVPIYLPGGVKLVVDFQIFYMDGTVSYEDVKGVVTDGFKVKQKIAEATYPIKIKIVKGRKGAR